MCLDIVSATEEGRGELLVKTSRRLSVIAFRQRYEGGRYMKVFARFHPRGNGRRAFVTVMIGGAGFDSIQGRAGTDTCTPGLMGRTATCEL